MVSNTCQCLHQFVFALRVKASIEAGIINPDQINHRIDIAGTGTIFDDEQCNNKEDLLLLAENAVALSMAGLAIAADEELDLALGSKDSARTDYPYNLRAVIYQIRNCFAHNLLTPTYKVSSKYLHAYVLDFLPSSPIIDFSKLDGTVLNFDNFGGFNNFYALFEKAESLV